MLVEKFSSGDKQCVSKGNVNPRGLMRPGVCAVQMKTPVRLTPERLPGSFLLDTRFSNIHVPSDHPGGFKKYRHIVGRHPHHFLFNCMWSGLGIGILFCFVFLILQVIRSMFSGDRVGRKPFLKMEWR